MNPIPGRFSDGSRRLGVFFLCLGVVILFGGWGADPEALSGLRFSTLGTVKLPAKIILLSYGLLAFGCGVFCVWTPRRAAGLHTPILWTNALGFVLVVLVWASLGRRIDAAGLIVQSLRLAAPIALGAMAGILCERCGVVNIAIEGMMLTGACIGFTAALYTHNIWLGLAAAVLGGMIMSAFHAVLSVRFLIDQIISGTVINILAVGVTGFIARAFLTHSPLEAPAVLPVWRIPWLSDIPVLGRIFFSHQPMVYTMLILVVVLHVVLFRTRWGLRTRTVGEHPRAADTLGVNVFFIRYVNVILSGGVAGLAGAWFSLETVGRFDEIMTGGKGFIALAAMIFGKWSPLGALGGALLFGAADAFQIKLQVIGVDIPYQFLGMIPYVATMIVLAGIIGRAVSPAADGVPYTREG